VHGAISASADAPSLPDRFVRLRGELEKPAS
jgi:hypothetical protein